LATIPDRFSDLLEKPVVAVCASTGPHGEPQSSPVWFRWDGTDLLISLLRTRQKFRNVQRDPRLSLTIVDPMASYRYLEVRGAVSEIADDPDHTFVNGLAHRYLGVDTYPLSAPGDERVVVRITPTHCTWQG
jgi:PPOX class probable F420-dependent enzyme